MEDESTSFTVLRTHLAAACNAGDTGKTGTFRTVTANIKSNPEMPQAQVLQDVRKVAAQGDLIGWQEISPARYFDAIKSLGKEWGHYTLAAGDVEEAHGAARRDGLALREAGAQGRGGRRLQPQPLQGAGQ